ncbi:Apoptotic ATPase [Handroanthus impetiginosus]|uniref:Apoptotic ATPase n=1 Tax=Handroanthus impetiginosus TaxID=429701 RepID=A0A2G9HZH9_9LAMI|nr:Apoptotic ATPase [Handroanthus impetiginosus]
MLKGIGESFVSKAKDKLLDYLVDYAQENVLHVNDYKLTLETLERKINLSTSRASDVKEEIKNTEMSGKKKIKREVKNWLKEIKKIKGEFRELEEEIQSQGFIGRFLGGHAAAKMNARVSELVEQSQHFGELLLDKSCNGEALLTTKLVGKTFMKNLERIWKFLATDKVSSIGIYGMGGVGKTTLMKHVNNRLVEAKKSVFWVTVSQECSIMMLQDKIAHVLHLDISNEHNVDIRAAKLNEAFLALAKKKNFVLILDDVWKKFSLEKVGDPLLVEGCMLILTTRSLEVCRQVGCKEKIVVETLNENESWNLFRETLGRGTELIDPKVEEIAKSMAKRCDGLPLGIITIAGSMRGVTCNYVWRNALRELKESCFRQDDDEEDNVFKVLKYSFDRLDQRHQHCFLYFSLYPEDYEVSVEHIVSKFISEELVDTKWSMEAQLDEGRAIVDRLVNVCLLERVEDDPESDVRMHDLLRAMALKITRGKTMVLAGCSLNQIPNEEEYWTKDLEKMSLMWNEIVEIPAEMSPNCPKLSTLLLCGNRLKFISESFFSQMNGLRVLDLSYTEIKELPNSLSNLEGLKALLLQGCEQLVYVPYLGKLKALKQLNLSWTGITEVPQGMEKLVNLKRLSMIGADCLEIFPRDLLPNFLYLQCLHLPNHIQIPIEEVESLKQLQEFVGPIKDMCNFNRFIRSQQSKGYDTNYYIVVTDFMGRPDVQSVYQNFNW